MIRTKWTPTIAYHFEFPSSITFPPSILAQIGMVVKCLRYKIIRRAITRFNKLTSTIFCLFCTYYTTHFPNMYFFCYLWCFYNISIAHCDTIISFCINFPVYYYYYLVRVVVISYILNLKPLETITFK